MATEMQFGVFVPQGWKMDLTEIEDPVEQFEAMTAVAQAADPSPGSTPSGSTTTSTPCPDPSWKRPSSAGPSPPRWPATPSGSRSARWSAATATATPRSTPRSPPPSTSPATAGSYAGIGAGWYEHEWKAYGYGWPETPTGWARFREAVEIIHKMWTEDYPSFSGKHYTIDKPINEPKGGAGHASRSGSAAAASR